MAQVRTVIEYKSNLGEFLNRWKKKTDAFLPALQRGLRTGMLEFNTTTVRTQMRGRPGLKMQTGNLANTWFMTHAGSGWDYVVKLATRTPYARIHQFGFHGKITAKHGMFAVPISPQARGHRPRDFGDLVCISRPGKAPLLIRQVRRGGAAKTAGAERKILREDLMYVLTPTINQNMPKRLHLYEEFKRTAPSIFARHCLREIRKVVKSV